MKPIVLTAKNFNNLQFGKPGLLFVYGDWCHFCVQFKPEFKKLADLFAENGDFIIAQIESAEIDDSAVKKCIGEIEGFPTLLFFDSKGKIVENYQGARTVSDLLKEICKVYKVCKRFL